MARFRTTAKKLIKKVSDLTFDQSSDVVTEADLIIKALEAAYKKGLKDAANLRTDVKPAVFPPDPKQIDDFWTAVQEEADRRFGTNEDYNSCVEVILLDRSRFERHVLMLPVPIDIEKSSYHPYGKKWTYNSTKKYIKPKHTPEEEEAHHLALLDNQRERICMITGNFEMAYERMKQLNIELEYTLKREIEMPEKTRKARIKELEHMKEWFADPVESLRKNGYKVDTKTMTYWYPNSGGKPVVRNVEKKPENFDALMKELKKLKSYKPLKPLSF